MRLRSRFSRRPQRSEIVLQKRNERDGNVFRLYMLKGNLMIRFIYIIGTIVVILAILSLLGLR